MVCGACLFTHVCAAWFLQLARSTDSWFAMMIPCSSAAGARHARCCSNVFMAFRFVACSWRSAYPLEALGEARLMGRYHPLAPLLISVFSDADGRLMLG